MSRRINDFSRELFAGLPARYDALAELLSFGQNRRWRREMVAHVVDRAPVRVLDVATGTAGVALQLADRSSAHIVGLDLSPDMLRRGEANVRRADRRDRVQLVLGAAERLPFPDGAFDGLTFTYLLRYVDDPRSTMAELARVVRPGAPVASLEFYVPPRQPFRAGWWLWTRIGLPAAGGLAGRAWWRVGRFLGPSISEHYRRHPLDRIVAYWNDAGIEQVGVRVMSLGGGVVMWGRKRDG